MGTASHVLWLAEEWFRQLVAAYHNHRGRIVVFDRHPFADYYRFDVPAGGPPRPIAVRTHNWLRAHTYLKPDLVICLDVPGEVSFGRKGEASVEWLERRRREYLQLATVLPGRFVVVDADRPVDEVTREVASLINQRIKVEEKA
jgi:thymidylate kinase